MHGLLRIIHRRHFRAGGGEVEKLGVISSRANNEYISFQLDEQEITSAISDFYSRQRDESCLPLSAGIPDLPNQWLDGFGIGNRFVDRCRGWPQSRCN
ncbi:hypothetical protein WHT83_23770 [Aminobacter sp. P9b]|uniref:hypothetical protein n=1 Tax=Aminobacter sp. P9b TaxID=3133697 RepID=UPI0032544342